MKLAISQRRAAMALVAEGRTEDAVALLMDAGLVAEAEQLRESQDSRASTPAPTSSSSPKTTPPVSEKRPGRDFWDAQTLMALEVPTAVATQPPSKRPGRNRSPTQMGLGTLPRPESSEQPVGVRPRTSAEADITPRTAETTLDAFDLPRGFVVSGRYRLESRLGVGGMAAVYRAVDLERGAPIAMKIASNVDDPELLSHFEQELMLCRKISHENVIRLHDVGTHGEMSFITMELLTGSSLFDLIGDSHDLVRDLGYLVQICNALHCVHAEGLVHRDVKPENIFVTSAGQVKLMDFGLAKRRGTSSGRTQTGFALGTPAYMAPEQVRDSSAATHLSDLYSIGVMAYQMFTGVLPFVSEGVEPLLLKQLNEVPKPPSVHAPEIPDDLDYVILQLLEKDPARRVPSCRDLAEDLDELRRRLLAPRAATPSRPRR